MTAIAPVDAARPEVASAAAVAVVVDQADDRAAVEARGPREDAALAANVGGGLGERWCVRPARVAQDEQVHARFTVAARYARRDDAHGAGPQCIVQVALARPAAVAHRGVRE